MDDDRGLSAYLKIATLIALALMLYPLYTHHLPRYVVYGDVAIHYSFATFLTKDLSGITTTTYPILFHLMSALIHNLLGLSVGEGMYLITAAAAVVLPLATYKLSSELTKHEEISLLAAFLSVSVMVTAGGYAGLSTPLPQILGLALMPLTLYLFASGRYLAAGVGLAAHVFSHFSWPLTLFLLLLYTLIRYSKDKSYKVSNLGVTMLTCAVIAVPFYLYVYTHAAINSGLLPTVMKPGSTFIGLSVLSFLWVFWPPLIVLLALYACFKIYREKRELAGYTFIILSFLAILLATQEYFLNVYIYKYLGWDIFRASTALAPDRALTFSIPFLSMLSAYAIYIVAKGRKSLLILVTIVILGVSVAEYYHGYRPFPLTDAQLALSDFLSSDDDRQGYVIYDSTTKDAQSVASAIAMGGKVAAQSEDAFLFLDQFETITCPRIKYLVVDRGNVPLASFAVKHKDELSLSYSNEDYAVHRLLQQPNCLNGSVEGYIDAFTYYHNVYVVSTHMSNVNMTPFIVMIEEKSGKDVCLSVKMNIERIECPAHYDFKVSGSDSALKYLFSHPYGIKPFVGEVLWLYGNGFIDIKPGTNVDINMTLPNKLSKVAKKIDTAIYLYDIGVYAKAKANESDIDLHITTKPLEKSFRLSLGFFAKTTGWTWLTRTYSYPNVIIGLPYAILSEAFDRLT